MATENVPTNPEELTNFAGSILEHLIERYDGAGEKFIDDYYDRRGLINSCAGTVSILLLVGAFEELAKQNDQWQRVVLQEFDDIHRHVNEEGYDATPLVPPNLTNRLFGTQSPRRYYYLDSVSWVLSSAILLRFLMRTGKLSAEGQEEELNSKVMSLIQETLRIIRDSVCAGGGWNFSNGCSSPHLYYSYAVSEALADFGDYVLGESPELFRVQTRAEAQDNEVIDILSEADPKLIIDIEGSRKKTSKWLMTAYLELLAQGDHEISIASEQHQHNRLYYTYYVLDMLIVCKADEFFEDQKQDIRQAIEHAIYRTRIDFDKAYGEGWFKVVADSQLELKWQSHENQSEIPSTARPKEAGLLPLSLRCNTLYSYYIALGEDKKIPDLFRILVDNRRAEIGLWDKEGYNIRTTERAIEAIVDYYDYLLKYERSSGDSEVSKILGKAIASAVRTYISSSEGTSCIVSALTKVTTQPPGSGDNIPALSENKLLEVLTSALAMGENQLLGKSAGSLDENKFRMFQRRLGSFASTLFGKRLEQTVKTDDEKKRLSKSLDDNVMQLFNRLGPWLSQTSEVNLGSVLEYLILQSAKEQQKHASGPVKGASRGGAQ